MGVLAGLISHVPALLNRFLPLAVIETSHFMASVGGAFLLVLARGLQRRLDAAQLATLILLIAGTVLSLVKGGDFEEAITLSFLVLVLVACRREFRRRPPN